MTTNSTHSDWTYGLIIIVLRTLSNYTLCGSSQMDRYLVGERALRGGEV